MSFTHLAPLNVVTCLRFKLCFHTCTLFAYAELGGGVCCLNLKICRSATCACASLARPLLQLLHCHSHLSSKELQSWKAMNQPANASSRSISLHPRRRLQHTLPQLLWDPPGMANGLKLGSALLNPRLLLLLLLRWAVICIECCSKNCSVPGFMQHAAAHNLIEL